MTVNKGKIINLDKKQQALALAMHLVSITYSVPIHELKAATRRKADIAFARQVAMYLAHVGIGLNLTQVAKSFERDRSTAAHACRLVEDLRDDAEFDGLIDLLERTLKSLTAAPEISRYPLKRKPPIPPKHRDSMNLH